MSISRVASLHNFNPAVDMKKIFIIFTAVMAVSVSSAAQQLNSAYFMESYKFRHDLNPAFASSRSYFSLALGDINADISSNMGISTFLYPTPSGQLTTFMNGSVSSEEFMKNSSFASKKV